MDLKLSREKQRILKLFPLYGSYTIQGIKRPEKNKIIPLSWILLTIAAVSLISIFAKKYGLQKRLDKSYTLNNQSFDLFLFYQNIMWPLKCKSVTLSFLSWSQPSTSYLSSIVPPSTSHLVINFYSRICY